MPRQEQVVEEIAPHGVGLFDQNQFPFTLPSLQLLFAFDRFVNVTMLFPPDKRLAAVLL
jgi:hypothetical protein